MLGTCRQLRQGTNNYRIQGEYLRLEACLLPTNRVAAEVNKPTETWISTGLTLLWDDFADLVYHIQQPPTADITARITSHLDLPRIDWIRQRLKRLFGTQ